MRSRLNYHLPPFTSLLKVEAMGSCADIALKVGCIILHLDHPYYASISIWALLVAQPSCENDLSSRKISFQSLHG